MLDSTFIDIKELARRLSFSPRTIRSWVTDVERPIPCYRLRGKLLFRFDQVSDWMESFKVKPVDVERLVDEMLNELGGRENGQCPEDN